MKKSLPALDLKWMMEEAYPGRLPELFVSHNGKTKNSGTSSLRQAQIT
jgi:hypothetical protein